MRNRQKTLIAFLLVTLLAGFTGSAAASVGQVIFTYGIVTVEKPAIGSLRKGSVVDEGDVIVTGPKGWAQVKLADGTKISIRPDSRFVIEAVEAPATATQPAIGNGTTLRAKFNLQRGGFRTITGGIARRDPGAYQVSTPSAVIRVRGTNYVARLCAANCGGTGDGLYVGVSSGGVSMSNNGGDLNLSNNQYGYAANFNVAPKRLVAPPSTLRDEGLANLEEEEEESEEESSDEEAAAEETASEETASEDSSSEESTAEESTTASSDSESTSESSAKTTTSTTATAVAANRTGTVSSGATATSAAASSPATVVTTEVSEPEREIVAEGAGGQPVDLTGGGQSSVPRGFAFALGTNLNRLTNSETLTVDANGNLTGFDVTASGSTNRFAIGTAVNRNNGFDANSQLKWGRWGGGVATRKVGTAAATNVSLDEQSLHYVLAGSADRIPTQRITGSAAYTLVGNTDPTDNLGHVGVLGSANFSADFTNQTVASNLELGINDQVWTATGTGSININLFSGLYSTVTVGGSSGGTGNFNGVFAGFGATGTGTPSGAGMTYELSSGSNIVNGAVVFGATTPQ